MSQSSPLEAECKFRVSNLERLVADLEKLRGEYLGQETHRDTYLRHPSRDFRETDEALRIREINGMPHVTYKGPRLAGPIKIRPEIELPLVESTVDGWLEIWTNLGFQIAATVHKTRRSYRIVHRGRELTVTLDNVTIWETLPRSRDCSIRVKQSRSRRRTFSILLRNLG